MRSLGPLEEKREEMTSRSNPTIRTCILGALRGRGSVVYAYDYDTLRKRLGCSQYSKSQFRHALGSLARNPDLGHQIHVKRERDGERGGGMHQERLITVTLLHSV
jgi:hypothetical protein